MNRLLGACALLSLLAGCASHDVDPRGYDKTGIASYYGARHHGKRTASGEPFNQHALTAAHPGLHSALECWSPTFATTSLW